MIVKSIEKKISALKAEYYSSVNVGQPEEKEFLMLSRFLTDEELKELTIARTSKEVNELMNHFMNKYSDQLKTCYPTSKDKIEMAFFRDYPQHELKKIAKGDDKACEKYEEKLGEVLTAQNIKELL